MRPLPLWPTAPNLWPKLLAKARWTYDPKGWRPWPLNVWGPCSKRAGRKLKAPLEGPRPSLKPWGSVKWPFSKRPPWRNIEAMNQGLKALAWGQRALRFRRKGPSKALGPPESLKALENPLAPIALTVWPNAIAERPKSLGRTRIGPCPHRSFQPHGVPCNGPSARSWPVSRTPPTGRDERAYLGLTVVAPSRGPAATGPSQEMNDGDQDGWRRYADHHRSISACRTCSRRHLDQMSELLPPAASVKTPLAVLLPPAASVKTPLAMLLPPHRLSKHLCRKLPRGLLENGM